MGEVMPAEVVHVDNLRIYVYTRCIEEIIVFSKCGVYSALYENGG